MKTLPLQHTVDSPERRECLTLPSDDLAPGAARSFTRNVLGTWGLAELADRALLIVSELVTNARCHGRTRPDGEADFIELALSVQCGVVCVEVADNCVLPPATRLEEPDAVNGRGLLLVTAEADAWTARLKEDGTGKTVLAFLTSHD